MKRIIITFFIFANILLSAQESKYYEKGIDLGYGVQNGRKIIQENDSIFVIAGNAINSSEEAWEGQFFKVNQFGNVVESVAYPPPPPHSEFKVFDMISTDFGYAITGDIEDAPNPEEGISYAPLLLTDFEGNIINLLNVGLIDYRTRFYNMVRDEITGALFLSGYRVVDGTSKLYMAKTDELGNIIWQKTDFGYDEYRNLFSHIVQKGPYYYLSAFINNDFINEEADILLIKIDGDGNILWEKVMDLGTMDFISEFLVTLDNEFLCTGKINNNIAVFKLDSIGDMIWQNTTAYLNCGADHVLQLTDKSFITSGCTAEEFVWGSSQLPIMKFSNDGEVLWKRYYGGNGNDYGYDIIFMDGDTTGKSGYVVTGRTYIGGGNGDHAYLVRTNCMGLVTELPQAQFTLTQPQTDNPLLIQLQNTSQYVYPDSIDGGAYTWQLGDGQKLTTTAEAPIEHSYQGNGVYTVTLTAIVCNDTSRLSKTICINANPSPAAITYTRASATHPNTLHFTANHPNHPDSVLWTFSTGDTSTEWSPTQTFNPDSIGFALTVTLTTYLCDTTLTTTRTIDLWAVGIGENAGSEVGYFIGELHPNPAQTQVSLKYDFSAATPATFELYDLNGRLVQQAGLQGSGTLQLDISQLATGMYFYQVQLAGAMIKREKLVIAK